MSQSQIVQVQCSFCGGEPRNHAVVAEHTERHDSPDGDITAWNTFQIIKCMGCDAVRFRQYETCTESMDYSTGKLDEYDTFIFPSNALKKHQPLDATQFPADVGKMYFETVQCFNAGANTLAGGGLRATVEAICRDRNAQGGNLQNRIDALVQQGVLAQAQAALLHEERYIGNEALHEMHTPSDQDIRDGLEIVEGLLRTVYVLPLHAARLQQRRTGGQSSAGQTNP